MLASRFRAHRRRTASLLEPLEPRSLLSTTTLSPVTDSYVRGGSYAVTNYGNASSLWVANQSDDTNDREAPLRFDVSSLNTTIRKATLEFVPSSCRKHPSFRTS